LPDFTIFSDDSGEGGGVILLSEQAIEVVKRTNKSM